MGAGIRRHPCFGQGRAGQHFDPPVYVQGLRMGAGIRRHPCFGQGRAGQHFELFDSIFDESKKHHHTHKHSSTHTGVQE